MKRVYRLQTFSYQGRLVHGHIMIFRFLSVVIFIVFSHGCVNQKSIQYNSFPLSEFRVMIDRLPEFELEPGLIISAEFIPAVAGTSGLRDDSIEYEEDAKEQIPRTASVTIHIKNKIEYTKYFNITNAWLIRGNKVYPSDFSVENKVYNNEVILEIYFKSLLDFEVYEILNSIIELTFHNGKREYLYDIAEVGLSGW